MKFCQIFLLYLQIFLQTRFAGLRRNLNSVSRVFQGCFKSVSRWLLRDEYLWQKTTFDERQPLIKDDLWRKTRFDERRLLMEVDLDHQWKKSFNRRQPSIDCHLWQKYIQYIWYIWYIWYIRYLCYVCYIRYIRRYIHYVR